MEWNIFRVMLRLRTPLHVGRSKIGNLQRTRSYVTGRVLWGALTHRLGRDTYRQAADADVTVFQNVGTQVHNTLATTYFYPALPDSADYVIQWPWHQPDEFALRFLRSYASTALIYPQQAAAEGTLHEVEFLSPTTLDASATPVYLFGYIFATADAPVGWQNALPHVQLGGERGYGWGAVDVEEVAPVTADHALFGLSGITAVLHGERPQLNLAEGVPLLAHTRPLGLKAKGHLEPFLGREQPVTQPGHAGQHVVFEDVCFAPGSRTTAPTHVTVERHGIWQVSQT